MNNDPMLTPGGKWEERLKLCAVLVRDIGFPILLAGYLLVIMNASVRELTKSVDLLTVAINRRLLELDSRGPARTYADQPPFTGGQTHDAVRNR